ncbi:hypothetical protein [Enterococcus casseliflavus]|uniref:hypothetical protein n=1 Tax=Enterococcus casseliflavus TaxID=37734 RepID=UPI0022E77789|nr:hypothetical protein [Enterococcus casseliflavus]
MNVNEKLAVLMEFNGYTKDELEAYLSLKFGSMTKGGMTASILSQSGYEKAKSVIFGQPQLNENQQIVLEYLKGMCPAKLGVSAMVTAYCLVDDNINDNWQEYSDEIPEHIEALQELSVAEENQVLEVFANWALEQEEE